MMVGAVLVQNTSWTNAERAIGRLASSRALSLTGLRSIPETRLASLIRCSGCFRIKARRIKNLIRHIDRAGKGGLKELLGRPAVRLREELLAVDGIGPETADCIVLYAAQRPTFVADAYARRILYRSGFLAKRDGYAEARTNMLDQLPSDAAILGELHALLVRLGKEHCRKSSPRCPDCPLLGVLCAGVRSRDN